MKTILLISCLLIPSISQASICDSLNKALIIAQDDNHTFLGEISNSFSSKSIFNDFGNYGSTFSSTSIWNTFSSFGSEYSEYSPFSMYSRKPPKIFKNDRLIGYLSEQDNTNHISPSLLKAKCKDMI